MQEHNSPKIAVCITAYNHLELLNRLTERLCKNFDVYVYIDKKSSIQASDLPQSEHLFVFKKFTCYWGHNCDLAKVILEFLSLATKNSYERYLVISGQDIPIMSNKNIINFFENNKNDYLDYFEYDKCKKEHKHFLNRVCHYHPIPPKNYAGIRKCIQKALEIIMHYFSLLFPRPFDYRFYGGENWFNFTHSCAMQILEYVRKHPEYERRFDYTKIGDEIFFQTIIMNECRNLMVKNNCLRYIDWFMPNERPKILRMEDYEKITASGKLFARKFDDSKDREIIDKLYELTEDEQIS